MTQYINKANLVAEIERIDESIDCDRFLTEFEKGRNLGKEEVCDALLYFLNTLEVKEMDLEEKAIQLSQKYFPDEENIWARSNIEAHKCKNACIEMVKWFKAQKEVDLEKELSLEDYNSFFKKYPDLSDDWGFDECWAFAKYFYELGLKSFLNTLEVKEIDFIKEFYTFSEKHKLMDKDIEFSDIEKTASFFFQLGFKAQKGE